MIDTILVLNAGPSNLKFQVSRSEDLSVLVRGKAVRLREAEPAMDASLADGRRERIALPQACDHETALSAVLAFVDRHDGGWRMKAVAHRIVHGGEHYADPILVTPEVLAALEALSPLAPLHQPHNLATVAAARRLMIDVPNIACFDATSTPGTIR